ncbi:MAG TPA: chromosomal protein MC1 [Myxococcales bacterium]|nr:chromosomal protein MC1 [Myxococcales bacterium]HIN86521.1 chromosomal protein MC1 [Myxococcales bacterium]
MATASGKKNFVLLKGNNDTPHVFSSRQPRGAALKAANKGHTNIRLRERGTNRVHVFTGKRERVSLPNNAPSWLAGKNNDGKVWKAVVSKKGVERL